MKPERKIKVETKDETTRRLLAEIDQKITELKKIVYQGK
jgi:hypothetical protein